MTVAMTCRGCGTENPRHFFQVDRVPASVGSLDVIREDAVIARCGSVNLVACTSCGLIQNQRFDVDVVGFQPGYEVSLMHSSIFRQYIHDVCDRLIKNYQLRNKQILEIGCGAGEFLRLICGRGGNRGVGIDPTIAQESREDVGGGTVHFLPGFFGPMHERYLGDMICCLSVFEDIPDPLGFLKQLRSMIGEKEIPLYFEVFNGFRSIREKEVWSIHYEQCNYFSLEALTGLFRRAGFTISDAGTCYQGDQYLFVEAFPGDPETIDDEPDNVLERVVADFESEYESRRAQWIETIDQWKSESKRIIVWGSGGKGISFLSALEGRADAISYVVDVNPDRQNRFLPLSGLEVVAPERVVTFPPDVVILTNALYRDEITSQLTRLGISPEIRIA